MKIDSETRAAYRRTEHTCQRLGLNGGDKSLFMAVFNKVREAEVKGVDLWPLWHQYMSSGECDTTDIAIAAYIEAVASTRKAVNSYGRS